MSSRTRGQQRRARRPQLEPNPGERAKLRAQFDASDSASFKKAVEMNKIDTSDIDISRPPFKNYIEPDWETPPNRQDHDVTVWLRDKYDGMILHDGEDGDDQQHRRIFKVIWLATPRRLLGLYGHHQEQRPRGPVRRSATRLQDQCRPPRHDKSGVESGLYFSTRRLSLLCRLFMFSSQLSTTKITTIIIICFVLITVVFLNRFPRCSSEPLRPQTPLRALNEPPLSSSSSVLVSDRQVLIFIVYSTCWRTPASFISFSVLNPENRFFFESVLNSSFQFKTASEEVSVF